MKTLTAALALVLAACGSSDPRKAGSTGTITVFAAASLTGTFTQLGKDFEAAHPGTTVKFSFAGSTALATQILAAAPADLFASASTTSMTQVTDAGAASEPQTFANNVAEIAVSPDSRVTGLADLPNVKLALCDPTVPCGAIAVKVLGNAHVRVRPVTLALDVKSTLAYVTNGSADAAIVYVTDVLAAGLKVKGIPIPADLNATTAYQIAPVKASKNTTLAKAFEDFVLSSRGQAALAAAGFQQP
jgi:molybdate transport system substrate-binding protein